ncbi:MAG: PP2C family protein-serine/threonine phosphatase [Longimicrobiales bacterium]|jgi:protein phosphatase
MGSPSSDPSPVDPTRKPRGDEIDVFGLTHAGIVREENQDHFLLCELRKHVEVHLTSLPESELSWAEDDRMAFIAMVADGVGGGQAGEEASRRVVGAVARYVTESIGAYYTADSTDRDAFTGALHASALRAHADVLEAGESDPGLAGMSTTLTLWIGVWPQIFVVQVGDSRHYVLRDDRLLQVTRDQTYGQSIVDAGILSVEEAKRLRVAHVLSSSLGGSESEPVVQWIPSGWNHVHMICTDGLTRHVSDDRIRDRLAAMTSARQVCEDLLQDALDGGGTDNITIIVGRAVRRDG